MKPTAPRPYFGDEDQPRVMLTVARDSVLEEDYEDLASEWIVDKLGEEKAAVIGPPDISVNPLAFICKQLSTPGLYGRPVTVKHKAPGAQGLIGPEGHLATAGLWQKMASVEYFTLGLGDYFLRLEVVEEGAADVLVVRVVKPYNVRVWTYPGQPDKARRIAELRLREDPVTGECVYAWDVLDLGGRVFERGAWVDVEPSYRVILPATGDEDGTGDPILDGEDVTSRYLEITDAEGNAASAYPYRWDDGRPFLPYVHHFAEDTGQYWHHNRKRGSTRGSLNGTLYATLTGHAAHSASGKAVVVVGAIPSGVEVTPSQNNLVTSGVVNGTVDQTVRPKTLPITPGCFVFMEALNVSGPVVIQEIGPGGELKVLSEYTWAYIAQGAADYGIPPTDIVRTSANPQSGAALSIENQGKRDFSDRKTPVSRAIDVECVCKAAALCNRAGLGSYPEDGYSVEYATIPLTAAERKEAREDADWQTGKGMLSRIDAYMQRHPGVSREDAIVALVQVARDEAELQAAIDAEGLEDPDPEDADPDAEPEHEDMDPDPDPDADNMQPMKQEKKP